MTFMLPIRFSLSFLSYPNIANETKCTIGNSYPSTSLHEDGSNPACSVLYQTSCSVPPSSAPKPKVSTTWAGWALVGEPSCGHDACGPCGATSAKAMGSHHALLPPLTMALARSVQDGQARSEELCLGPWVALSGSVLACWACNSVACLSMASVAIPVVSDLHDLAPEAVGNTMVDHRYLALKGRQEPHRSP